MTTQALLEITRRLVGSGKGPFRGLIVTTPWLGESFGDAILCEESSPMCNANYDDNGFRPASAGSIGSGNLSRGERVTRR
jgi:hypothetical protein